MGSPAKTIRYEYDIRGNRSLMVDPDGGRFTYAYNPLNQLSHQVNPQGDAPPSATMSLANLRSKSSATVRGLR